MESSAELLSVRAVVGSKIRGLSMKELKDALRSKGLKVGGTKTELQARLASSGATSGSYVNVIKSMSIPELKAALKERGLKIGGTKSQLQDRLLSVADDEGGDGEVDGTRPSSPSSSSDCRH